MPRHVRDSTLESRTGRARLKPQKKPFLRALGPGLAVAYRKPPGTWSGRKYIGAGSYLIELMRAPKGEPVIADDFATADGVRVMTFSQAQDAVREWARSLDERDAADPTITVRSAVEAYVAEQEKREGSQGCGSRMKRVLEDELADKVLALLTPDDLARWQERTLTGLADSSAQRITNDLKSSLNAAAKRHRDKLPPSIRDTIRDGLARERVGSGSDGRDVQILSDADVRRIIAAAWEIDADIARLVVALAATGARFSQLVRMRVVDVQVAEGRLLVPVSRKGRGRKKTNHVAVRVGDDVLAALAPATAGRRGHEPLFLRPYQWRERGPWLASSQLIYAWRAIVERAGLPASTIPYALRHSSIVRGLRAGLPIRLVAALHDTSSAMIEKHYSAFVVDAMDELAARAIVPLTTAPAIVVQLRK